MKETLSAGVPSPWHQGELTLQRSVGAIERMVDIGQRQLARNFMPEQHREFYAQLPFVVLGSVDTVGNVWATLRTGQPGFMHSPVPQRLALRLVREPADPADAGIEAGKGVGMLGIELHTRRRNRLNGNIHHVDDSGFDIEVTQAYGNCAQYIQLRQYAFVDAKPGEVKQMTSLAPGARAMIAAADSFYVASYIVRDGVLQVDVSHRGGKPGFVKVADDDTLTIPDFAGNQFFNTLGNFLLNPRAGLVFVDFRNGDLLQMSGCAEVILDAPEINAFTGAERVWRFKPQRILYRPAALPLRWSDIEDGISPNVLTTGDWSEVAHANQAKQWRQFSVGRIVDESPAIKSFYLIPTDTAEIPQAYAGQHLPIRLVLPGTTQPQIRTYTLSSAPADGFYRISVKREGVFSSYLHDVLALGDTLEARAPAGSFIIDSAIQRPVVLLGAGIGVTPLLSMIRQLMHQEAHKQDQRPIWLFQSARNKRELAFGDELGSLVQAGKDRLRHIRVLSDTTSAEPYQDYDVSGRITLALLKQTLPFDDYDFYLCGPGAFMQQMYDSLRGINVADGRIHAEAFGPSSLQRKADEETLHVPVVLPATTTLPVLFTRAEKKVDWVPESGTLLEFAEQNGLSPEFSCRSGSCGTCRTRILSGSVAYPQAPGIKITSDEALICCAVPAQGCIELHLDL